MGSWVFKAKGSIIQHPSNVHLTLKSVKYHVVLITQHLQQGNLYMMGSNQEGKLGINDKDMKFIYSPLLIDQLLHSQIVDVSCGDNHTVAVTSNGECYSWGQGIYGALGIGQVLNRQKPTLIEELRDIKIVKVSCGARHTLFLANNGEVYSCGDGEKGQLGLGCFKKQLFPKKVDTASIQEICGGELHSLFLTQTMGSIIDELGMVWVFGLNEKGELGVGDYGKRIHPYPSISLQQKQIKSVSLGSNYAIAISELEDYDQLSQNQQTSKKQQIEQNKLAQQPPMKDSLATSSIQQYQASQQNPFLQNNMSSQLMHSPQFNDTKLQSQDLANQFHLNSPQAFKNTNQLFNESNMPHQNQQKSAQNDQLLHELQQLKDELRNTQQQLVESQQNEQKERELRFEAQQKLVELEDQFQQQLDMNMETKQEIDQLVVEIQQLNDQYKAKEDELNSRLEDALAQIQQDRLVVDDLQLEAAHQKQKYEDCKQELERQDDIRKILHHENQALLDQLKKFSQTESLQLSQLTVGGYALRSDSQKGEINNTPNMIPNTSSTDNLQRSRMFKSPLPFNIDKLSKSANVSPTHTSIPKQNQTTSIQNQQKKQPFDYNQVNENSNKNLNTNSQMSVKSLNSSKKPIDNYNQRLLLSIERKAKKMQNTYENITTQGSKSNQVSPKQMKIQEMYQQHEEAKSPPREKPLQDKYKEFSDYKNQALNFKDNLQDRKNQVLNESVHGQKLYPAYLKIATNSSQNKAQNQDKNKGILNQSQLNQSQQSDLSGYQFLTQQSDKQYSTHMNLLTNQNNALYDQHQTFQPSQIDNDNQQNYYNEQLNTSTYNSFLETRQRMNDLDNIQINNDSQQQFISSSNNQTNRGRSNQRQKQYM
eukprot:403354995